MKKHNKIILISLLIISICQAQEDIINTDYMLFGRKEPVTSGSMFSALGNEPIFFNPANVAFITDNRITIGASASDLGDSYMLAWTAPNISISSARQASALQESEYSEYRKDLLKFSFGLSNLDLGLPFSNTTIALGIAVKQLSDKLFSKEDSEFGGNAMSVDFGLHFSWKVLTVEMALLNMNAPQMGDTELSYARATSLCLRYRSPSGFMIAMQGISSNTYAGSDVGINIAGQQSFLDHRLVSRIQLTSFFSGTEAIMQNISASVGYRPVIPEEYSAFQDIEFSYALSFLSLPQTVGTHLLVLTKYF